MGLSFILNSHEQFFHEVNKNLQAGDGLKVLSMWITYIQRDEKIGIPGNVAPASTMKMLPETYLEESCTKYRTSIVNAGSEVPSVFKGTVLDATLLSQLFCIRLFVISDLKIPGEMELTLILCAPNSRAITYHHG